MTTAIYLSVCILVLAGESTLSGKQLFQSMLEVFPVVEAPWVQDPVQDKPHANPPYSLHRSYTHDDRRIDIQVHAMSPNEKQMMTQMLEKQVKALSQIPEHSAPMEGRGSMHLLSSTNEWAVIQFDNKPKEAVRFSGVHKTQPISFVATSHARDGELLKSLLARSLGVQLDAAQSVDGPCFVVVKKANPEIYVYKDKAADDPSPAAMAYANLMRGLSEGNADEVKSWIHPDMLKELQEQGMLDLGGMAASAKELKSFLRIEIHEVQIKDNAKAKLTAKAVRPKGRSSTSTPTLIKLGNRWVVSKLDD